MKQIQNFFKQILESIDFLHENKLTHTDLKPENILLKTTEEITSIKNISDLSLKVIDFGSATFDNEYHTTIINTRQYRAPEVIIGTPWDKPSDVWGIACIILELYTGDLYFSTHESTEHYAMIEKNSGPTPLYMAKKAKIFNKHFKIRDENRLEEKGTYYEWPLYKRRRDEK